MGARDTRPINILQLAELHALCRPFTDEEIGEAIQRAVDESEWQRSLAGTIIEYQLALSRISGWWAALWCWIWGIR
jgi:hypothetical protein